MSILSRDTPGFNIGAARPPPELPQLRCIVAPHGGVFLCFKGRCGLLGALALTGEVVLEERRIF